MESLAGHRAEEVAALPSLQVADPAFGKEVPPVLLCVSCGDRLPTGTFPIGELSKDLCLGCRWSGSGRTRHGTGSVGLAGAGVEAAPGLHQHFMGGGPGAMEGREVPRSPAELVALPCDQKQA